MMKRLFVLLLALAAVAGCTPQQWTRPNTTASQFDLDKQQCMYQMNLSPQSNNPFMAYELIKECLRARGYTASR